MLRLALFQPDMPQNTGAAIRLCACLCVGLDIIEPCGFVWDERKIRRSAMDYYDAAAIERHASWADFSQTYKEANRIILLTTKTDTPYTGFAFQPGDILLAGRESAGVPQEVHERANARVTIPMRTGLRSINVINAAAMVLGEALRQIRHTPEP